MSLCAFQGRKPDEKHYLYSPKATFKLPMTNPNPSSRRTYLISLGILAGMFFIFGAVSWVNSILIPYFRICCELTHFESLFRLLRLLHCLFHHGDSLRASCSSA